MKKRLFILSFIFLTAINHLKAQHQITPPKKSSKIVVLIRDTSNTLLDRISAELFDKGYTIDSKDDKAKFLVTKARPSKEYGTMSRIRTRINDTAIVFSSQIALNTDRDIFGTKEAEKTFYDVDYSGSKKSAMREAWNELEEIAKKFGDKITYSR